MRLALSTALIVIGGEAPDAAITQLIDGFSALDLPVIRIGDGDGSAFTDRRLEARLEERGILTLVLCGGAAEATARDALSFGFRVFVADDTAAIAEVAAALDVLRRRRA